MVPRRVLGLKYERGERETGLTALGGLLLCLGLAAAMGLGKSMWGVRAGGQGWTDIQAGSLKERKSEMGYVVSWPAIFRRKYSDNPHAVGWGLAKISADKSQDVGVQQKLENIDAFLSFLECSRLLPGGL